MGREEPDYAATFAALPTPYIAMTPDLVIAACNNAYCATVGRSREELVGQHVMTAFPPTPDALDESGVSRVQLAWEQVRDTGRPVTMPLQKYDIPDGAGGMTERYWSLTSVPVLDEDGRVALVVQRTQDVTDYVHERQRGDAERSRGQAWQRRVEEVEADLYDRSRQLEAAVRASEDARRRVASLAEVALAMTGAQTLEQLTDIIFERGLAALGADGGGIAVRDSSDVLQVAITASLGEQTRTEYGQLPLRGSLPASVAAASGERVLVHDSGAADAPPELHAVTATTGCRSWACLPLRGDGGVLGSLSVGWSEPREFSPEDLEVLEALAAQCAQGLERIQVRQAERHAAAASQRMSETLQRSLLTEPPQPEGLQIAVRYRPAAAQAQVGGDWYDAFLIKDGTPALAIGDVAGHDRDAAAAMGQVRNLLRGIAYTIGEPPAAVLAALDRALRDLAVGSLATAVYACLGPREGGGRVLTWSNAGHPPPVLLDPDGGVHLLRTDADLLLGLDADTSRVDHEHPLAPGSTLLLYTDGLVERRDQSIDDGLAHLCGVVADVGAAPLEELCDLLLDRLGKHGDDDIALLAVRVG